MDNPTYEKVSSGISGHTETIQIIFNPKIISYEDLLYIFFRTHDPTTMNRQGADVGTQYRSAIFFHNDNQKREAEKTKEEAQTHFSDPIVTEIVPFKSFFKAGNYPQNYHS